MPDDGKSEVERFLDSGKEIVRDFISPPDDHGNLIYDKDADNGDGAWVRRDD